MVYVNWTRYWLASAVLYLKGRSYSLDIYCVYLGIGERLGFVYFLGVCSGVDVGVVICGYKGDNK